MSNKTVVPYENPDAKNLRARVDEARARLAEVEVAYTIDKAKVDSLQASLFQRLRTYRQERDRLRIIVDYRRQFLAGVLRGDEGEAERVKQAHREADARNEREYEETAQTLAAKKELTAEDEAELGKLWKSLVKLYHPDRFAHEPDKLETYGKLTAAINRAKDNGDFATLKQIANDPHGFILKQGWASLDFRDEEQAKRLAELYESLMAEIRNVHAARPGESQRRREPHLLGLQPQTAAHPAAGRGLKKAGPSAHRPEASAPTRHPRAPFSPKKTAFAANHGLKTDAPSKPRPATSQKLALQARQAPNPRKSASMGPRPGGHGKFALTLRGRLKSHLARRATISLEAAMRMSASLFAG